MPPRNALLVTYPQMVGNSQGMGSPFSMSDKSPSHSLTARISLGRVVAFPDKYTLVLLLQTVQCNHRFACAQLDTGTMYGNSTGNQRVA
jgi:hypothetical protein